MMRGNWIEPKETHYTNNLQTVGKTSQTLQKGNPATAGLEPRLAHC